MPLEDLLKPVKVIDTEIHHYYEKLGNKLDKIHKDTRYFTCAILVGQAFITSPYLKLGETAPIEYIGYKCLLASDQVINTWALPFGLAQDKNDSEIKPYQPIILDPLLFLNRIARTPLFFTGIAYLATGTYNATHETTHPEVTPTNPLKTILIGVNMIALASSMYLKDKDPKLLQKDPFWKKAYDAIKGKIQSYKPEPVTIPLPTPTTYISTE